MTRSPPAETRAFVPSGVNLSRLAPWALAWRVAVTFLAAISMTERVPSQALATHACAPLGVTSKPSEPRPTGMTVSFQSPPGGPGGGPPGARVPGGGTPAPDHEGAPVPCDPAPAGGGLPACPALCSRIVTVAA